MGDAVYPLERPIAVHFRQQIDNYINTL